MTTGRRGRACLAVGALLLALAFGAVPAAAAPASLQVSPSSYDFGPVPYDSGPSEPHEFTLTNTGSTQLTVKRWRSSWVAYWPEAPDPFWAPSPSDCHVLEPGESCSFQQVFDPAHPGAWKGWQKAKSQDEEEPWAEVVLYGEGTGPWVPITPGQLVFGSTAVGTTTTPQTITVESQDREELAIEDISITPIGSPSSPPFQVSGGSCHEGGSLAPGGTCTIEVVMAPTASGPFQAKLEIADTAPDSPQSVALEGSATAAPAIGPPPLAPLPAATAPLAPTRRSCPKGKRRVVKKGRQICVKKRGTARRGPGGR